ncbi:MAG: hypothetical protein WCT18_01560 [Patescibacteria group bacterium]
MKRVKIAIKGGTVNLDFDGFAGKTCSDEEDVIRALYGKMGVKNDVTFSDNKREEAPNGIAEREKS